MKKLALITMTCLVSVASLLLAWQLRSVVGILLMAIILATTMSGFVALLVNRGWSQRGARLTIIVGTLLLLACFIVLTVYAISERLPQALNDFRTMYGELRNALFSGNSAQRAIATRLPQPARLDDLLLGSDGSGLLTIASGISANFGVVASNLVLVVFVALYWVADRERIERLWLSLLSPQQRVQARALVYQMEEAIGTHLRSQIVQYVLSIGLLMVGYTLWGLKYPFLLAWFAAIVWFVPLIGGFLALIPALLLGLINGYGTALAVVLYTLLIFVLVPMLTQRFHSLHQRQGSIMGLMITIALIDVMGMVGLVVAMPVTVAIHVLLGSFFNPSLPQAEESPPIQLQSMLDKLAIIQNRIQEGSTPISPSTRNLFERLQQLVTAIDLKDRTL